jgi:hypothetical protein
LFKIKYRLFSPRAATVKARNSGIFNQITITTRYPSLFGRVRFTGLGLEPKPCPCYYLKLKMGNPLARLNPISTKDKAGFPQSLRFSFVLVCATAHESLGRFEENARKPFPNTALSSNLQNYYLLKNENFRLLHHHDGNRSFCQALIRLPFIFL